MTPRIENEARIDVLAVIRKASQTAELRHNDATTAWALWDASAAVAELIEAADGLSPWFVGYGNSLDFDALHKAQKRLEAALVRMRGDA